MKNKRSAIEFPIEFLMTYGWAILVVLVSLGALVYFVFLQDPQDNSELEFQPVKQCVEWEESISCTSPTYIINIDAMERAVVKKCTKDMVNFLRCLLANRIVFEHEINESSDCVIKDNDIFCTNGYECKFEKTCTKHKTVNLTETRNDLKVCECSERNEKRDQFSFSFECNAPSEQQRKLILEKDLLIDQRYTFYYPSTGKEKTICYAYFGECVTQTCYLPNETWVEELR